MTASYYIQWLFNNKVNSVLLQIAFHNIAIILNDPEMMFLTEKYWLHCFFITFAGKCHSYNQTHTSNN